jgi:hypothetical protein
MRMRARKPHESRLQALLDITLIPAVAHLPSTVRVERRDVKARQALVYRIYGEYTEMQGLSLTREQAARLFGLPSHIVARILQQLTDASVLYQTNDGRFALRVEESPVRPTRKGRASTL